MNPDEKVSVSGLVRESVVRFLDEMEEEPIRVDQLGLMISKEEALEMMKRIYL